MGILGDNFKKEESVSFLGASFCVLFRCCWGCDFYLKMVEQYCVLQCFRLIRVPNPR